MIMRMKGLMANGSGSCGYGVDKRRRRYPPALNTLQALVKLEYLRFSSVLHTVTHKGCIRVTHSNAQGPAAMSVCGIALL